MRRRREARAPGATVSLLAAALLSVLASVFIAEAGAVEDGSILVGGTPPSRQFGEVFGVVHSGPKYSIPTRPEPNDILNEGADRVAALGARTIKLWFNRTPANAYPNFADKPEFDWPQAGPGRAIPNLAALAAHPFYANVFSRPEFDTVLLVATEFTMVNWRDGLNSAERNAVENEFADLTGYLINEYEGTGKTFILQNWEGDNLLRLTQFEEHQWDGMSSNLIAYFKARQAGVEAGRAGSEGAGVRVLNAIEINWNMGAADPANVPVPEEWTVLNRVVRDGYEEQGLLVDLYSWSNWSANIPGEEHRVIRGLDYMRERVPSAAPLAPDHIYLGEFGARESSYMTGGGLAHDENSDAIHRDVILRQLDFAWRWGVRHAIQWALYANGLRNGVTFDAGDPVSLEQQHLTGTWLVRPPGPPEHPEYSFTGAHDALAALTMQRLYTDSLDDLSSVYSHNGNWSFATNAQSWDEGASSRAYRADSAGAWIVYRLERDLTDFNIKAFGYEAADLAGRVMVAYSPNGDAWTPSVDLATADAIAPDPDAPAFRRFHLKPGASIPAGTRYLRIELPAVGANWSTQLAEVRLMEAPARPDPAAALDETGRHPLLDYALGSGGAGYAAPRLALDSGGRLRFEFSRRADPGLVYAVEATEDLTAETGWSAIWASQGGENIPGPVAVEDSVEVSGSDGRFLRLRIGVQP
ncbi:MAG: hypothetical protein WD490_08960 [Opitutales bacterium]